MVDTVSVDEILIAQPKDETLPTSPTSRKIDKSDGIRPSLAKPETNKHIGKKGKIDTSECDSNRNHTENYVLDQIVYHTVKAGKKLYRIRWYVQKASDDTVEAAENILEHLIPRYWQKQNRRRRTLL